MINRKTTLNKTKTVKLSTRYSAEWQYIHRKEDSRLNRWIRPFRFHIDFCTKAGYGFRIELAKKFYLAVAIKPNKNTLPTNAQDV
jgi:hypothetical protein